MTDVTQYKPGDHITLEHPDGSVLVREVVPVHPEGTPGIRALPMDPIWGLSALERAGWTVTKHEPAVEIPTEPNTIWADRNGYPWFVTGMGNLVCHQQEIHGPAELAAPFTLLRPVDEVRREMAEEVIDWLGRRPLTEGRVQMEHAARKHFGLVSE